MTRYTGTYSPEDNKLRLYASSRLDDETYKRVKRAGFIWAPQQELFVAPMWTPEREDLLLELCGEIEDEDKSLVDRAEDRADRFRDYSDKRSREAESARKAVSAISDNIPLGQPILVGHHSERRARKDAERIETGMRRAINLWETSKYWTDRARGALAHAKYKERPDVRHRRIKKLESEIRIYQSKYTIDPRTAPQTWDGEEHVWCGKGRGGHWEKTSRLPAIKAHYERWIRHLENRIAYEKAMLGEQGGIPADQFDIEPGGQVLVHSEWVTVIRVNRTGGKISSVTTNARYVRKKSIEEIQGYRPPTDEQAAAVKKATSLAPLCNYRVDDCLEMTEAEWKRTYRDYKGTETIAATETDGRHRRRFRIRAGRWVSVFITDAKVKLPPKPDGTDEARVRTADLPKEIDPEAGSHEAARLQLSNQKAKLEAESPFAQMKESLRTGVQVVAAPQLFPTPPELAKQMVRACGLMMGRRVLEPSAGTGNIIRAILNAATGADCVRIVAVEINTRLADRLREQQRATLYANDDNFAVHNRDFLECTVEELGTFNCIVMNPPYRDGADIKHILHAKTMLRPGGRLVALCANGPRQNEKLKPLAAEWEPLPEGSFKEEGTNVNVVMLVINN